MDTAVQVVEETPFFAAEDLGRKECFRTAIKAHENGSDDGR